MSEYVTISYLGEPIAVSRVRFSQTGRAFTPAKTRNYLGELNEAAKREMRERKPFEGPLSVVATFEVPIPKSTSRKRANAMILGLIKPTKRPDLDNLIKALDAFNNVVWLDDAQVIELQARKRHSKEPKVVVTITELGDG